jgi:predicted ABC-type ATPase
VWLWQASVAKIETRRHAKTLFHTALSSHSAFLVPTVLSYHFQKDVFS